MATADTTLAQSAAPTAAKVPFMTLLICCLLTVLFAVGSVVGTMLYLDKHGKLASSSATRQVEEKVKPEAKVITHPKALEPMLINLADEGGHAYLRITVVLAEEDETGAKGKEEAKPVAGADASVRDTIFDALGRENSASLLAPDGKEKLKAKLLEALLQRNAELKVKAIYFTDFLVQQ